MKKIAKFASLLLTLVLMFSSFTQVANADEYKYEGYMSSFGNVLKIKDGQTEVDGWCINLNKTFLKRWGAKNPLFKKLDPTADNLKRLVEDPKSNSAEELLTRVKQVIKYSENHRKELESLANTFKGRTGFEDHRAPEKEAYFLAVQGAIWSLTDYRKAGSNPTDSRTRYFPTETQKKIKDLVKQILQESVEISYFEYNTIHIGIYEAENPRNQNIITREKPTVNTFKVKKTVSGFTGEENKNKEYEFSYTCTDGQSGKLVLQAGEEKVADKFFPIGTSCTIKENADSAKVDGYTLLKPKEQTLTIGEDETAEFVFVNKYEREKGAFLVQKHVTGTENNAGKNKQFEFSYSCGGETGTIAVKGNGELAKVGDFPLGTSCSVKEVGNTDVPGYVLKIKAADTTVVLAKNKANVATFNNHYEKVEPEKATFQVKKLVTGVTTDAAKDKEFEFSYTCGDQVGAVKARGDGVPVSVGKEFPVGTSCTVKEVGNTDVPGYVLKIKAADTTVVLAKNKANVATFNNHYEKVEPEKATFQVKKLVTGVTTDAAKDKEFEFSYTCGDQVGAVKARGDGVPVSVGKEFPVGTSCTVKEVGNTDVPGYVLKIKAADTTVVLAKNKANVATFNNHYEKVEPEKATFQVKKLVTGVTTDAAKDKEFEFSYTCGDQVGAVKARGDGVPVSVGKEFPVGTSCTVKEVGNTDVPGYVLKIKAADTTVVLAKNKANVATFNNHYEKVEPEKATFQVKKLVTGVTTDAAKDKEFEFSYTCGDQVGAVKARGDGVPVSVGKEFPVGTSCTVKEVGNTDVPGYVLKIKAADTTVVLAKNKANVATFNNHYEKVEPEKATFQVKKLVTGVTTDAAKDKEFEFSYTCGDQVGAVKARGDGVPVSVGKEFPVGTSCTVKEVGNTKIAGFTLVKNPDPVTVEVTKSKLVEAAFVNDYKPEEIGVTFSKVIAGQGKELAGASLKIVEGEKADGKVVHEWTSEGQAKVFGLTAGVYTMVEDQAPLGFDKAESITFRVSFDKNGGKVEVKQGDEFVVAKDAKVVMEDKPSLTPEEPTPLAKTGLEIGGLGILAIAMVAIGCFFISRKKKA